MVIFVLRHADRRADMGDGLSPEGTARAERLAHMLSGSGVSEAFHSDALRTRDTLAPLAQALGAALTVTEVSAAAPGGPDAHVEAVVAAIEGLQAGSRAVVVSHSNTVGPIIEGLGGGSIEPIGESEFDRLFVLFRAGGGANTLLKLRY